MKRLLTVLLLVAACGSDPAGVSTPPPGDDDVYPPTQVVDAGQPVLPDAAAQAPDACLPDAPPADEPDDEQCSCDVEGHGLGLGHCKENHVTNSNGHGNGHCKYDCE